MLTIARSRSPRELQRQDQQKEYRQGAAHDGKVYVDFFGTASGDGALVCTVRNRTGSQAVERITKP
jgi:hypothetical protein